MSSPAFRFMTPAIKLMNRLSYNQKFTLISLLWLQPILGLGYLLVSQINDSIEQIQNEAIGVDTFRALTDIQLTAHEFKDLKAIAKQRSVPEVERLANDLKTSLDSKLSDFIETTLSSEQIPEAFKGQAQQSYDQWQRIVEEDNHESDYANQYRYYDELSNSLANLRDAAAQTSGLAQDNQADINILVKISSTNLEALNKALSKARSLGVYGLKQGAVDYVLSDGLNELYDELSKIDAELRSVLEVAQSRSALISERLSDDISSLDEAILGIQDMIDNDIINPIHLERPWLDYKNDIDQQISRFHALHIKMLDLISELLTQRLDEQVATRALLFGVLSAVLLVILYLYMAFSVSVRQAIGNFGSAARSVSAGDLTVTLTKESRDELGALTEEFNNMTGQISELIRAVNCTVEDVSAQTTTVNQTASSNAQAIARQLAETNHIFESMKQLQQTVEDVNSNTEQTLTAALAAETEAKEGHDIVDSTLASIDHLDHEIKNSVDRINQVREDTKDINQVLVNIKSIAEQTNLLALNAAIEAARAGEQGRGFAVVADEVRSLSLRTQHSTEEIDNMIERLEKGVFSAVEAMHASHATTEATVKQSHQVAEAFDKIVTSIDTIVSMGNEISQSAQGQRKVASNIESNVNEIVSLGNETEANASSTQNAAQSLRSNIDSLKDLIGRFKI